MEKKGNKKNIKTTETSLQQPVRFPHIFSVGTKISQDMYKVKKENTEHGKTKIKYHDNQPAAQTQIYQDVTET